MPPESQEQHKPAGQPKWPDGLAPKMAQLRDELARRDPEQVADCSGARFDPQAKTLQVELWDRVYTLIHPEYIARDTSGAEVSAYNQALLLMYLHMADGTPLAHKWLAYRELPGGMFYANAFHEYAEMRLAQAFSGDVEKFRTAAIRLKGRRLTFGDASFEFVALPRVLVAAVYWLGDEDFPPNASILFDAAVSHYLPIDAISTLGRQLVTRLISKPHEGAQTQVAQPPAR